jgi:hypothetical protein
VVLAVDIPQSHGTVAAFGFADYVRVLVHDPKVARPSDTVQAQKGVTRE